MAAPMFIEVAVPSETNSTERGRVLAKFARRLLETQNFEVADELRLTGMEVDLLAKERTTGERVLVECKAHRANIAAEVIYKILGQVTGKGFSAGWLISTHALSKDAKGFCDEWEAKPPEENRRLQVYAPERLIQRLVNAGVIKSPASLQRPAELRVTEEVYLLLTLTGEYWAIPVPDLSTGVRQAALLFDAPTGTRVLDEGALATIAQTDTSLADLTWLSDHGARPDRGAERLREELQSIVRVPVADHWADYRPARPEDFVGRDEILKGVFTLLDRVRTGETRTRLLAIKAPSGWGKSSCVLKIAASAERVQSRKRIFIFAVDCRAAATRRFGELALFRTFEEAIRQGFISDPGNFAFGGADNPFATEAMRKIVSDLKRQDKVVCLLFDQFEELLYKDELSSVFDEIKTLCNAVDEAQENVVVGFSWKTDGAIPPEHKAYHLWHSLADRRLEFELPPFTVNEVSTALNRFSKELGQPLVPQLRRLLQDHCQGYPWLLKKLCIHVLAQAKAGLDQNDILVRSLSIQELFEKDVELLSAAQIACLKATAADAPAEFFKIVNTFGEEVVSSLVDRRLMVKTGPRLNIYWDIFRDYLLTGKAPQIPVTYVPQAGYVRYAQALSFLLGKERVTYGALANELGVSEGATDNIVRDLVSIGNAEANRQAALVRALQEDEISAAGVALAFCQSHVVYRKLISEVGQGSAFTEEKFKRMWREIPGIAAGTEHTWEGYTQRMLRWFLGVGLIEPDGDSFVTREPAARLELLSQPVDRYLHRGENVFFGEAPPDKVIAALDQARSREVSRADLEARHGQNTVTALVNLGLLRLSGVPVLANSEATISAVRTAASTGRAVVLVRQLLANDAALTGEAIGEAVARHLGRTWSRGSMRRCGGGLRRWVAWLDFGGRTPTRQRRPSRRRVTGQALLPTLFPELSE